MTFTRGTGESCTALERRESRNELIHPVAYSPPCWIPLVLTQCFVRQPITGASHVYYPRLQLLTSWQPLIGFYRCCVTGKCRSMPEHEAVETFDTAGCCAAAKSRRVLSCLRSFTVALSQQARLMLSDHRDRRQPCPSSRVCVSVRSDQPCHNPGARIVRLNMLSLTGRSPVTAKIEVNRSTLVHVRGAHFRGHTDGPHVAMQNRSSDRTLMSMLRDRQHADSVASTTHRHPLWAPEGLLKACRSGRLTHWHICSQ